MAQYEEYKLTHSLGFEKIPTEWNLKKVKYLFDIGRGRVISQEELMDNGLYPVFSSQTQNNGCLGYINTFDFDCEQLTWTTDGANAGTVFIRSGKHNCTNVCGTLQPITKNSNLKFSHYALQYATQFHKRPDTNGAKIMNNEMAEISFALPPEQEQFKIVEYLNYETAKIDHLIEKQQQLIELLKEKRQAVISHAVTKGLNPNVPMKDSGVEWLGEVPEHWTKSKLVSVADGTKGCFVNGPFGSDLLANELRDEGVPVVYIRDIKPTGYKRKSTVHVTEQKARQLEICNVKVDDVIISKVGDPPGDACLYPKGEPDAIVTQDVIRIRVDRSRFNPKFIVYLLNSDFGRLVMDNISVEGTRKRVSLGDFKDTRFVFPPLKEQELIVENLNSACKSIDLIIARAIHGIGLIQERRTALISAAVTGKIDVRNWQAPTVAEAQTELSA